MNTVGKNYFKFIGMLFLCFLVRLIPFRAPNIEPILATLMPISRIYGKFSAFFFATASILFFDLATRTFGVQTLFTTLAYGVVALWSVSYFKKNKTDRWSYVRFAIFGTLFFDAFTGLTVGPIFFHQSFYGSLVGQIPFTALHLVGNTVFAFVLSPTMYNFLIKKREKEKLSVIGILLPKTI